MKIKNKIDLIFLLIAISLAIILVAGLTYSIKFLVQNLTKALNPTLIKPIETVTFNLKALDEIKSLLKKEQ